jgi:hypothetical protein
MLDVYYGTHYYEISEEYLIQKGVAYLHLSHNGMRILTQREYADYLGRDKFPNIKRYKFVRGYKNKICLEK